jgi:hypothetical protein
MIDKHDEAEEGQECATLSIFSFPTLGLPFICLCGKLWPSNFCLQCPLFADWIEHECQLKESHGIFLHASPPKIDIPSVVCLAFSNSIRATSVPIILFTSISLLHLDADILHLQAKGALIFCIE